MELMKERLKKVIHLYKQDWQRIFKIPIATALMIALMIVPSLYAWFNIEALWDPYSNTSHLKVGIYNEDKGTTIKKTNINIGEKTVAGLKNNNALDWQFETSKAELDKKVQNGQYYAGITIPQDFSKDLVSVVSGNLQKPELEYQVNDKINAIAPKITDKGASTIQETISKQFIQTASHKVILGLNEVGYNVEENLASINRVKSLVLYVDKNIDTFDEYVTQIQTMNKKFPKIEAKYNKAKVFYDYLPLIDQAGSKVITLNKNFPEYLDKASIIKDIANNKTKIKQAGMQISEINKDFSKVESIMANSIDLGTQATTLINQLIDLVPDLNKVIKASNEALNISKDGISKLKETLPKLNQLAKKMLEINVTSLNSMNKLVDSLNSQIQYDNVEKSKSNLLASSKILKDLNNKNLELIDDNIKLLKSWQALSDSKTMNNTINQLQNIKKEMSALSNKLNTFEKNVNSANDGQQLQEAVAQLINDYKDLNAAIEQVDLDVINKDLDQVLANILDVVNSGQNIMKEISAVNLSKMLNQSKDTIQDALKLMKKYQKQLPAIKSEIATVDNILNGHMKDILDGIDLANNLYTNQAPVLQEKLGVGAKFFKNDWSLLKSDLINGKKVVDDKLPEVKEVLTLANNVAKDDWPSIKKGVKKAASAIKKGEKEVDLKEIIRLLKSDANKESDFLANPVELNTKKLYNIPNYGSASTPFYTALCLWVGALLFSSIATTKVHIDEDDENTYSHKIKFSARALSFITVAIMQALIASIGDMLLLHTYVADPIAFVLFSVFISIIFMSIIYSLVALFNNLGKGIAIIILVLSISSGGGNFPIELSSGFFQFVNPLVPFTYAVNLLREAVGGIYLPAVIHNMSILAVFGVAFIAIGLFLYPKIYRHIDKMGKEVAKSHLLH